MPQQIDNPNDQPENSDLEAREALLISHNNATEKEAEIPLKSKVVGKKPFTERWKTNRFWLVRGTYYIFYSVWVVVMAIGTFIAWLIAMLFI